MAQQLRPHRGGHRGTLLSGKGGGLRSHGVPLSCSGAPEMSANSHTLFVSMLLLTAREAPDVEREASDGAKGRLIGCCPLYIKSHSQGE